MALLLAWCARMETIRLDMALAPEKAKVTMPKPAIKAQSFITKSRSTPASISSRDIFSKRAASCRSESQPMHIEPATPVIYIRKIIATI